MRAAILLSVAFVICGIAAQFGVAAIHVFHRPIVGILGFATSLVYATVPPLVVLGWRKMKKRWMGSGEDGDVPPNTSLERTREG